MTLNPIPTQPQDPPTPPPPEPAAVVNLQAPALTVTTSGFGTISGAYPPRNIQLGSKLTF